MIDVNVTFSKYTGTRTVLVQSRCRESLEGGFVPPVHTLVRTQPSTSAYPINMAKTAAIFAVVALCVFVADGQSDPPPLSGPNLGYLRFCSSPDVCYKLGVDNYGCNNVPAEEVRDMAVTVHTKHCFYLFEHINCEGRRVRVGPDCYRDDCCPKNLEDCNFRNIVTSYMLC
uniref:Activin_recp domain-containing protein n=1 Tax=Panagrellus redivivus TaxID=6233 RepID=A0A7E4WAD8_PANRE